MKGLDKVLANLNREVEKIRRNQERAVKSEADSIMAESKNIYAPKNEGELIESGFVNDPVREGDDVTISMGYTAKHAVPLHEHPSASSPPTWQGKELKFTKPGTGPKFLEQPLMKAIDGMPERIAERMKLK